MWFITFIVKNLLRRPLRSSLTIIAVAIAIGALVALVGVAEGFEQSFLQLYETEGVDLLVIRKGVLQPISSSLDEDLEKEIQKCPGVKAVLPGLVDMITQEVDGKDQNLMLNGWIPETEVFNHLTILAGRSLTVKDTDAVILGTTMAGNLNKKVGDQLKLLEKYFNVVGIFETPHIYENGGLVMPLKVLQDLMGREGRVSGFSIILKKEQKTSEAAIDRMCRKIEAIKPGALQARTAQDFVKNMFEIRLAKGMAWVTSFIALIIGFFGIMNTMVMSVHERTREIGILRAVGWRPWRVMQMILLESVVLSILGAIVGVIGALTLVHILAQLPTVNSFVEGKVSPLLILYGQLLAVTVGLIGGALPALRAARMLPTAALRYE